MIKQCSACCPVERWLWQQRHNLRLQHLPHHTSPCNVPNKGPMNRVCFAPGNLNKSAKRRDGAHEKPIKQCTQPDQSVAEGATGLANSPQTSIPASTPHRAIQCLQRLPEHNGKGLWCNLSDATSCKPSSLHLHFFPSCSASDVGNLHALPQQICLPGSKQQPPHRIMASMQACK